MKKAVLLAILLVSFLLSGCAANLQKHTIQSYEIKNPKIEQKKAFTAVQNILLDKNFDIKISNPDAGLLTTEYKKYDEVSSSFSYAPPFDFYLQIKTIWRTTPDGQTSIKLSPIVKSQNRLNPAAFTEGPLEYYELNTDSGTTLSYNEQIHKAIDLSETVVAAIVEALGSSKEDIIKHIDGSTKIKTAVETKQPQITKQNDSKTDYINSIALQNIHLGDTTSGNSAIFGEIRNTGNKTLKTVELTINCLDQNGKVIYTVKYHPVWAISKSPTVSTPFNSGESRTLGFKLSNVPTEWDKKVDVKVTDIEFVE